MRILCVMPHYHADANANNNCMQYIIAYFQERGHKVDILCTDNKGDHPMIEKRNGCTVISVVDYYNKAAAKHGKRYGVSEWTQLPALVQLPVKAKCYIKTLFRPKTAYYSVDAINYRKICKAIKGANPPYDVVLSHSFPFAAHTIGKQLRKRKIAKKWYALLWDPFVYNKLDPVKGITKRQKTAEKILNDADGIFMLEGLMEENLKNKYCPLYHKKATNIHLPILTNQCDVAAPENPKTVLVYSGAFYADIRRPDVMLDVLSQFPNTYELQIFGNGCKRIIQEKAERFTDCTLVLGGRVSKERSVEAIKNANILVNVGNTVTNQLPSKVFEYISFGKPIINFYSTEQDMGLRYFGKYPLCFNFNINNYTQEDVSALLAFCEENKNKQLTFDEATKDLADYRSASVCQKICEIVTGAQGPDCVGPKAK